MIPMPIRTVLLAGGLAAGLLLAACGKAPAPGPTPAPPAAPEAPPPPAAQAPEAPEVAPTAEQVEARLALTPEALEALLAPIALYPDPVLTQVLLAATNPQMVLDAGNWLLQNQDLKGKALDQAAEPLGFSPSMRALLQFPEVVDMMCMKLDWTTQLGEAFTADQAGVLAAVQRLRQQSVAAGNLKSSPQMTVKNQVEDGKEVIVVQPADPKVIYVPKYDPVAVYAPPPATIPPPTTTTTVVQQDTGYSTGALVTTGLLSFGAGLLVANIFDDDDDDYYRYYPNYGYGGVYYGPRPYYPPPPGAYRPPYGGSYRPGYGYNRPPDYQHNFNNNTIIINNQGNDYWNKFGPRPTPYSQPPASPITRARGERPELAALDQPRPERAPRPAVQPGDQAAGWQGQAGYAGARDRPATVSTTAGSRPAAGKVSGAYAGATPEGKAARDRMVAGRPPATSPAGGTAATREQPRSPAPVDRGYAGAGQGPRPAPARESSRPAAESRAPAARPASASGGDRSTSRSQSRSEGTTFSGAGDRSNSRAASQRGRQSMPQGARSKGSNAQRSAGGGKGRR